MRVAILTSGRFHACDLARELAARGHDVKFYSLVPAARTRRFGLPDACNRWLGPRVGPLYVLSRLGLKTRWANGLLLLMSVVIDRVAARLIEPCDLFIGMSQMSLRTIDTVRLRFGARAFLERGSRHILSQREILERLPRRASAAPPIPRWAIQRELAEYALADVIVVPSRHAEQSFVERGVPSDTLFRNPYGVDLSMFPATPAPPPGVPPTIIMAGAWSLQKGCDVLTEAWRRLPRRGTRLLHVGPVLDAPLPADAGFTHRAAVDQRHLTELYAQAHVMGLASRQEGLGLVLAQALASGLHVAATAPTGVEDLQEQLDDRSAVAVAPADDVDALATALDTQLERACAPRDGLRDRLGTARERLTWSAYGARYDRRIRQLDPAHRALSSWVPSPRATKQRSAHADAGHLNR
jgi:glycosyltransferase involved in cell wall biosynthesis